MTYHSCFYCIFEVKVNEVNLGDVLRQIELYRQYTNLAPSSPFDRPNRWYLATTYPMTGHEVTTLEDTDIHHIRLGPGLDRWIVSLSSRPDESARSITL